jgi:general secretion pathway protein B
MWALAAVGLAVLAVVVAVYAAWRPAFPPAVVINPTETADAAISADLGLANTVKDAPVDTRTAVAATATSNAHSGPVTSASAQQPATAAVDSGTMADPVTPDAEPQVLVVPAPPKPGERLPRGADELRRAVLGPDAMPPASPRVDAPTPVAQPERTPVPPDLLADIEDFKRSVQSGAGERSARSSETSRVAPNETPNPSRVGDDPVAASFSGQPAPLTSDLRRRLPPFSMTVHVYDPDPERSFVYVNGSKVREGELTRDGFFVEQVVADGAIIRYDDHRFFKSP